MKTTQRTIYQHLECCPAGDFDPELRVQYRAGLCRALRWIGRTGDALAERQLTLATEGRATVQNYVRAAHGKLRPEHTGLES